MGLSTAERNRRKRERKKKEREQQKNHPEDKGSHDAQVDENGDVEIEYVAEQPILPADEFEAVLRVQQRAVAAIVSDDENKSAVPVAGEKEGRDNEAIDDDDEDDREGGVSKRRLRELLRPSVADLKRRVQRPDLVEAHDVTAADPDFLITLKSVPGTVPVPRHWGRKRKYLQGKRGFEKPPFQLPDFIVKTGITEVRDTAAQDEASMSAKQKNRMRVAPKMGAIDVDYKTLYDAFFKHQTKPTNLTKFGELYWEGKELEVKTNVKPGWPFSKQLRDALGMTSEMTPPPWLVNMQRYGPPPSYASLKIPGLNAPLPSAECQYGYHPGGWGKPPIDQYGRPLYGGNPFDPPGSNRSETTLDMTLVTSDGKTLQKAEWGALPTGEVVAEEFEEEESSGSEMEESDEEAEEEAPDISGIESVLPTPLVSATAPKDLRKQAGDETPMPDQPKQLYKVIQQTVPASLQAGAVFASDVAYVVPGTNLPEGAESVLSKAMPQGEAMKQRKTDHDDDEDLEKKFKF